MYDIRLRTLSVFILLSACLTGRVVRSQGLMGGFKGHHHRGTGAVELLLATGILAKLLNHRAKYGPSYAGRHILHALIGGPRYPPRYTPHGRYPLDATAGILGQDDLMGEVGHASMAIPFHDDLLLNQESSIFSSAKSPLFGGLDSQLLAEAQLQQQLMAAKRARKMLEARKLLAAQEAKNLLVAQSQAAQLFAAQDAAHFLQATPSRQVLTSASPPSRLMPMQMSMLPQMNQMSQMSQMSPMNQMSQMSPMSQMNQMSQMSQISPGGQDNVMMGSEKSIASRSDPVFAIPTDLSDQETVQIIASLASRAGL